MSKRNLAPCRGGTRHTRSDDAARVQTPRPQTQRPQTLGERIGEEQTRLISAKAMLDCLSTALRYENRRDRRIRYMADVAHRTRRIVCESIEGLDKLTSDANPY